LNLPDRNEIETALAGIRAEIAEHRRQMDGLVSNRRHMYRQE
jgi:hypothetical protein